jgi:hypothetical protein
MIDICYSDGSRLVFEPTRAVITGFGSDGDDAITCISKLQREYAVIPD